MEAIVIPSGPLPKNVYNKNGKIIIEFDYIGNGLKTFDDKLIRGFSFDGKHMVSVYIKNETIVIPFIVKPEYIYYDWKPYSDGNLVNSENLPTSTFKLKIK